MDLLATLRHRFEAALTDLLSDLEASDQADPAGLADMVLPSQDAKFGDYQANCAMPLGKKLGKKPREVAEALIAKLKVDDLCEAPEIAGPGFINLKLREDWIINQLATASKDLERIGVPTAAQPRKYVLDYSSPNLAKPMHVGHIRSTVIGDCLYNVLGFLGHQMISDNHIGDWGTQFGMIIYGYKQFADAATFETLPLNEQVPELTRLYRLVNQIMEYQQNKAEKRPALAQKISEQEERLAELQAAPSSGDAKKGKQAAKKLRQAEGQLADSKKALAELDQKLSDSEADSELMAHVADHPEISRRALEETAKLHAGDSENRELWTRFLPACLAEMQATYDRLGVTFDNTLGESYYQSRLAQVVESLTEQGLATESDGAMCVFLEGQDAPFIVRKQDGAFLYATTDLATIQYRVEEWQPDALLYVVDHRQSLHFEQLFETTRQWKPDDADLTKLELQHIGFGTVLGDDGKPYKTRSGTAVGLVGLLDEAVQRARKIADGSDLLTTDEQRQEVAERIGIGAVKYADLAHNRTSDYTFNYDKMLAMNGNTAAYLQYSYARVRGIFARGEIDPSTVRSAGASIEINEPAERALAVALLQFAETLSRVAGDYRPNHLTAYLFELASRYSEFFQQCPVLKADSEATKTSRLLLCDLTARTIEQGLRLLGIRAVERM